MQNHPKEIRWKQRLRNLERSYADLSQACARQSYSKLERSGLIKTFEFTFDLAWKTLQDLLTSRGYTGVPGPKPVLEQAFQDGVIGNGEDWMKMLISRNLTVHGYDEKTAEEIATQVKQTYFPLFSQLMARLRKEAGA